MWDAFSWVVYRPRSLFEAGLHRGGRPGDERLRLDPGHLHHLGGPAAAGAVEGDELDRRRVERDREGADHARVPVVEVVGLAGRVVALDARHERGHLVAHPHERGVRRMAVEQNPAREPRGDVTRRYPDGAFDGAAAVPQTARQRAVVGRHREERFGVARDARAQQGCRVVVEPAVDLVVFRGRGPEFLRQQIVVVHADRHIGDVELRNSEAEAFHQQCDGAVEALGQPERERIECRLRFGERTVVNDHRVERRSREVLGLEVAERRDALEQFGGVADPAEELFLQRARPGPYVASLRHRARDRIAQQRDAVGRPAGAELAGKESTPRWPSTTA